MKLFSFKKLSLVMLNILLLLIIVGCGSQNTSKVELWGQADATEIDINSKIPGRVIELFVEEGELVKKGQILAKIDAQDIEAKRRQAEANVSMANAQTLQAEANLNLTKTDLNRFKQLYDEDAISAQSYEAYVTKLTVDDASYQRALAAVSAAENQLKEASIALNETDIVAAFDGVIVTKYIDIGAMVSTGMPIFALQDTNNNWVDIKVDETVLNDYKIGKKVKLEARDGKSQFEGKIVAVSKKPNFATKKATNERGNLNDIITYNVKIAINNKDISPGMRFKILEVEE